MKSHWTDNHIVRNEETGLYVAYDEAAQPFQPGFKTKKEAREFLEGYSEYLQMQEELRNDNV